MIIIQSCTLHYTLHLYNKYIKLHLLCFILHYNTLLYKVVQGLLSLEQNQPPQEKLVLILSCPCFISSQTWSALHVVVYFV